MLTTIYIPTILVNIIGHITNYFKPFYFESAIAVNITVMLVLVSMYISVVASVPVTSYIKMIEIWLLFNLIIPFLDVVLACYVDYIRLIFKIKTTITIFSQSVSMTQYVVLSACLSVCLSVPVSFRVVTQRCS